MRTLLACIGLIAVLLSTAAKSQEPLPPEIRAAMSEARKDCSASLKFKKGFLTRRDVNGDGVTDFILDYGAAECGDRLSFYCGSGGCTTQVFASLPDGGYAKVLDDTVRGVRFDRVRGRPAMVLDLHGSACGKVGAEPCRKILLWNGRRFVQ